MTTMTPKHRVSAVGIIFALLTTLCWGLVLLPDTLNAVALVIGLLFFVCGFLCFCTHQIIASMETYNVRITGSVIEKTKIRSDH